MACTGDVLLVLCQLLILISPAIISLYAVCLSCYSCRAKLSHNVRFVLPSSLLLFYILHFCELCFFPRSFSLRLVGSFLYVGGGKSAD